MNKVNRLGSVLLVVSLLMSAMPTHTVGIIDSIRNGVEKYFVQKKTDEAIKEGEANITNFIKTGDKTAMTLLCVAVSSVIGLIAYQAICNGDNKEVSFFDQLLGMLQWAFGKNTFQGKADAGEKHIKENTHLGSFVAQAEKKVESVSLINQGLNGFFGVETTAPQQPAPQQNTSTISNNNNNQPAPAPSVNNNNNNSVNLNNNNQQPAPQSVTTGQSATSSAPVQPQPQNTGWVSLFGRAIVSGIDTAKNLFGEKKPSTTAPATPALNQ